jgi:hypothetical protein
VNGRMQAAHLACASLEAILLPARRSVNGRMQAAQLACASLEAILLTVV